MVQHWDTDPGLELKRAYQRNMLMSMALVYGAVGLLTAGYLAMQGVSVKPVAIVRLTQTVEAGSARPPLGRLEAGSPGAERDRTLAPVVSPLPVGLFSLGNHIRVIPDYPPRVSVQASSATARSDVPGPEVPDEMESECGDSSGSSGDGTGYVDYDLPPGPVFTPTYTPQFSLSGGDKSPRFKKNRPLRIHLAGLEWPAETPTTITCQATVEAAFNADGTLNWKIRDLKIDSGYTGLLPRFEKGLRLSLYRTWFEPAIQDGNKVTQLVTLHATFCPGCEPKAWTEAGNMIVSLTQ